MKRRILFALILMGFTSLIVQVLLIREFLITFYGNELTIGLILACWIISEAFGSGLASKFASRVKSPLLIYASFQVLISIYLPISIFLIRNVKNLITATPGEAIGIIPIFASCLFIIGPLSIFDGMQFPFGCRIYGTHSKNIEQAAGRVYVLEAIGFILAGPIFTCLFLTKLNSVQICLLIGFINLVSSLSLMRQEIRPILKRALVASMSILILLNLYLLLSGASLKLQKYSIANQWRNQNIIEYKNSIYGNLAVSQKKEQYTFYSDGIPIINIPTPDIVRTEDFVHFAMLCHPNPKRVLFLSGGAGGPINETLKHPVDRIDYAELDPSLFKLLKKFPKDITKHELSDPRINLHTIDGIRFVKQTRLKYDVVFINLPYPSTLQLNRYYTKEFFIRVKKILNHNGELVLALPGSLSYLNKELKQLNLCILNALQEVFASVFVIPGDSNLYISSPAFLNITPETFLNRIKQRNISTKLLTPPYLDYRLQKYWQDWFYQTINKGSAVKENKDLAPSGVFYGISYWNSMFNPQLRKFFRCLGNLRFNPLIFGIIIAAIFLFIIKNIFKLRKIAIPVSIATTGFAGMSLNLMFILFYQVFFGYVYHHIALLITSFMLGLTAGGWIITKNLERIKRGLSFFIIMEFSIISFCIGSGLFLNYLNGVAGFSFYPLFYILSIITGFLVGAEFPLANKLYWQGASVEKTAGALYSMDLLGAFFAALLVSIVLVPIFGVLKTCLFLALLKTMGLILFFNSKHRQ